MYPMDPFQWKGTLFTLLRTSYNIIGRADCFFYGSKKKGTYYSSGLMTGTHKGKGTIIVPYFSGPIKERYSTVGRFWMVK